MSRGLRKDPKLNILLRTSFPDQNPYEVIGITKDVGPPMMQYVVLTIQSLQDLNESDFQETSPIFPLDLKNVSKNEQVRLVLVGESNKPKDENISTTF